MQKPPKDPIREERIHDQIIVDAYKEGESALSWYYYLQDTLAFPFRATVSTRRASSPLKTGQIVTVTGMADEEECEQEMFVYVRFPDEEADADDDEETDDDDDALAVPLSQILPLDEVDEDTTEAIADWHYWVGQGYEF